MCMKMNKSYVNVKHHHVLTMVKIGLENEMIMKYSKQVLI